MGSVYRAKRTKPIPPDAQLLTRRGERIASWRDGKGRKRTAKLTADGDRIVVESSVYTAKWRNGSGVIRKQSTGCHDRTAAFSVLAELMRRAETVKSGICTAAEYSVADFATTPISEHIGAYIKYLKNKHGRGAKVRTSSMHVANVERCLGVIVADCGFERLRDLSRRRVDLWIKQQREAEHPPSARTTNSRLSALCSFSNWAVSSGRLVNNPFAHLAKLDEKSDPRRQRRALTTDESQKLLYVARWRPLADRGREKVHLTPERRKGRSTWTTALLSMATIDAAVIRARETLEPAYADKLARVGRERALIYKTMLLTGLRRGEMRSLTVGQVELEASPAYIRLNASDAKNGSGADIPLRRDLADDLRSMLDERLEELRKQTRLRFGAAIPARLPRDEKLLNVPTGLVRILDRDLRAAGIAKRDDRGRTIDVHSLRHTFASCLTRSGASPKVAQEAMRHASIRTTLDTYTHLQLHDLAGAIDALPSLDLNAKPNEAERVKATGTDPHCSAGYDSPMSVPTSVPDADIVSASESFTVTTHQNAEAIRCIVSVDADNGCHSLATCDEVEPIGIEPTTSCMPCKRQSALEAS